MHLAAQEHLLPADDGDVVLGLAGHHARAAAGAGRQIDGHAPAVEIVGRHVGLPCASHFRPAVEAVLVEDRRGVGLLVAQRGVFSIFGQRSLVDQLGNPLLHGLFADPVDDVMVLDGGQGWNFPVGRALTPAQPLSMLLLSRSR